MGDWVPFENRSEWKDIEGIPEFEIKCPIGPMKYSKVCKS